MMRCNVFNEPLIGIDLGARQVKLVQARPQADGWRLDAVASFPRRQPAPRLDDQEVQNLLGVLERQNFRGNQVVLAVPTETLMSSVLDLPVASETAPIDQIARMEIARLFKLEPNTIEVASWKLPAATRSANATRVMATACAHPQADELLRVFDAAGLDVVAMEAASCSIARSCEKPLANSTGLCGVLDLGWQSTQLVVLYQNTIIYERVIPNGGVVSLLKAISKQTGLDEPLVNHWITHTAQTEPGPGGTAGVPDPSRWAAVVDDYTQSIADELSKSFTYASHQYQGAAIDQAVLVGGGAGLPLVARSLEKACSFKLTPARLADLIHCPDDLSEYAGSTAFSKALGLAMHVEGRR